MLPRARTVSALCLCLGMVALFATGAQAADPPARVLVPDPSIDLALGGDGQEPSLTAEGPSGTYRNPALGGSNIVNIAPDRPYPYYGRMELIIDDRAPASRKLFLDIKTPTPIAYTCVKGPENPGSPSSPRWGARIGVQGGKAQLLCYNAAGTQGYMVYTTTSCVSITAVEPEEPPLLSHYVIDGRDCKANVYTLSRNKLTPIKAGSGKNSYYKVFDFPIYLEADA